MADLYWFWHFVSAFWTTVVLNCAQPVNWEYCFPVSNWLVPWAHDMIHMYEDGAYHNERMILKRQEDNRLQ